MVAVASYVYNLGQAFAAVARAQADRPAIRGADGTDCSYAALFAHAARIANGLAARGIGRGAVVALQHGKSVAGYAAMLACLMRGAAYANLDAQNPTERLRRILGTCRPSLVLSDAPPAAALLEAAAGIGAPVLTIAAFGSAPDSPPELDAPLGSDIAYVMFTSGSTGLPKGVAIAHASVLNFVAWARTTFSVTPHDVFAGANPVYFDNSVFDFYGALFNGACLAPLDAADLADARRLVRRVDAAGCTVWFSVPSLLIYLKTMKVLGPDAFARVRTIVFGGEGYPKPELARLHATHGERARLVNVYGPTECTCICSAHPIGAAELEGQGLPTLGRLAPNIGYRVLDGDIAVAPGEIGELCLLGPQLALGYLNDPERAAAAFVPDPLDADVPRRMYRTGDLVREQDGLLYFVGRADHQIKHMGYRIELEEIEAALHAVEGVRQAAAIYRRVRESFGLIVAHVATEPGLTEAALRTALQATLPAYMLPNRFVLTDTLPKNANGKVDRVRLREAG